MISNNESKCIAKLAFLKKKNLCSKRVYYIEMGTCFTIKNKEVEEGNKRNGNN